MLRLFRLLKLTAYDWMSDNAPRLGAALAFYSVLSLGPLLVISIALAGTLFGEEASRGQLMRQMDGLLGAQGAEVIQTILAHSRQENEGLLATILGIAALLIGASGAFAELQDGLNTVWKAKPDKTRSGLFIFMKRRALSFAMVLVIGFLLLASLAVSTVLTAMGDYVLGHVALYKPLLVVINGLISFGVVTLLFALMFKILPDVSIHWRDVWAGAVLTSALFTGGKFLIGLYLGQSALSSTFGAAGSFVVLLVWIYYSAQILYFGAEFTYIYAKELGSKSGKPVGDGN